ncbi:hypothetical protein HUG10_20350 (plasmid) [Halorarum halophilum]|uniref:DUF8013 domain-containing protein n=1 Tax=Halorarum halophilum TaxID=2743090 RepID=A0A7D5GEQ8_9EURY|nr:hypothetical protein [Halobaculum halophilum]QLG29952.1 hypothetical protein HUG10_20350 [Halobaculum halophilum]
MLKAARWWYLHGKGGTDPAFEWAIEWTRHLATDAPSDVEQFDEFLEYLTTLGFADEKTSPPLDCVVFRAPKGAARSESAQLR